jgi:hypothetical protein
VKIGKRRKKSFIRSATGLTAGSKYVWPNNKYERFPLSNLGHLTSKYLKYKVTGQNNNKQVH